MMSGGIAYTYKLTEYIAELCNQSEAVKAQMASPDTDILTGLPFRDNGTLTVERKAEIFRDRLPSLSEEEKAKVFL